MRRVPRAVDGRVRWAGSCDLGDEGVGATDARVVWTSCGQTAFVPHRHMRPQVGRVVRLSGAGWPGEALCAVRCCARGYASAGCGEVSGSAQLRQLYALAVGASTGRAHALTSSACPASRPRRARIWTSRADVERSVPPPRHLLPFNLIRTRLAYAKGHSLGSFRRPVHT